MIFTAIRKNDNSLSHYGVKGQKWGVHNYETKLRYGEITGLLDKGKKGNTTDRVIDETVEFTRKQARKEPGYKDSFSNTVKEASELTKALSPYAKVAIDNGYNRESGVVSDAALKVKNAISVQKHPDVFSMKSESMTPDQDQKAVNPFYRTGNIEYNVEKFFNKNGVNFESLTYWNSKNNCASCSLVYDLRRRGYDVDANMTQNMSLIGTELKAFYPGAEYTQAGKSLKDLNQMLGTMPSGSRGELNGTTVHGSGHSIAWEMTDDGIVYRDCQTNKKYSPDTIGDLFAEGDKQYNGLEYVRLDDKVPDLEKMYQEGIVSKTGIEDEETLKNDQTRDAVGMIKKAVRINKFQHPERDVFEFPDKSNIIRDIAQLVKWPLSDEVRKGHRKSLRHSMVGGTCYLVTMDTGEQFLAHHGVQGMKWGKWNAETAARYAGGGKGRTAAKKYVDFHPDPELSKVMSERNIDKPFKTKIGRTIAENKADSLEGYSRSRIGEMSDILNDPKKVSKLKSGTPEDYWDEEYSYMEPDPTLKTAYDAMMKDLDTKAKNYYDAAENIRKRIKTTDRMNSEINDIDDRTVSEAAKVISAFKEIESPTRNDYKELEKKLSEINKTKKQQVRDLKNKYNDKHKQRLKQEKQKNKELDPDYDPEDAHGIPGTKWGEHPRRNRGV